MQRHARAAVAAHGASGRSARFHTPRVLLVDVGPHVQPRRTAHQDEGLRQRAGLSIFARVHLALENLAVDGRSHHQTGQVSFHALHLAAGFLHFGAGDVQIRLPRARL